jgi:hypothetical protein
MAKVPADASLVDGSANECVELFNAPKCPGFSYDSLERFVYIELKKEF